MIPSMAKPGLTVQPTIVQSQVPISQPAIATSSIKYTAPQTIVAPTQAYQTQQYTTTQPQTVIQTSTTPFVHQQAAPTVIQTSATPVVHQAASKVTTVAGCPPPVQGQPIIIEGVVTGAQSYIAPQKQTVLLQGAQVRPEYSQVQKGESKFEYVPYEQIVTEYDQLEKKIRIPINKYITEYQVIDHQVEYHPEITYQTETDYKPSQRVEEEVQYQTQEKRIEHGFRQEMRKSQRIEGAVGITSTIQQQPTTIIQSTSPVQTLQQVQALPQTVAYQQSQTYVTQPQAITTGIIQPQAITTGVTSQAPVAIQGPATINSQIPQATTQWPAPWTNDAQKRKSS